MTCFGARSYAASLTAFARRSSTVPASWGAAGLTVACPATVAMTFNVYATTVYGENIYLSGSLGQLTDWSSTSPIAMSSAGYPTWSGAWNRLLGR